MVGFGGMLSFEVEGGWDASLTFTKNLTLIPKAVSLGGVESTITSPMETSHAKMSAEARKEAQIADGLLRLSVGIEDADDLIADIENALNKI